MNAHPEQPNPNPNPTPTPTPHPTSTPNPNSNPNPKPSPNQVGENAPPEQRNPRMWAQSKRQAREVMHESARSRGLPPPKLKK